MYQSLIVYAAPFCAHRERKNERVSALATYVRYLVVVWLGAAVICAFAVDANAEISEVRNPLLQAYMAREAERSGQHPDIRIAAIENVSGVPEAPFFSASESKQCREKPYRFCRDLSQSEFRLTSLQFMVPEVPGLKPKSLTFRHNSVIANYTFR